MSFIDTKKGLDNSFCFQQLLCYNAKDIYFSGNPTFSLFSGPLERRKRDQDNCTQFEDGCNVPLEGLYNKERYTNFSSYVVEFRSDEGNVHKFRLNRENSGDILTGISTGVPLSQIKSAKIIICGNIYSSIDENWIRVLEKHPNKKHQIPFPCFEKNMIGMPVDPIRLVAYLADIVVTIETKTPVAYLDLYANCVMLELYERRRYVQQSHESRLKMYKTVTIPIPENHKDIVINLSNICNGNISCLIWTYRMVGSKKKEKASDCITFSANGNVEEKNGFFYTRIQKEFVGLDLDSSTYCKSFAIKPTASIPTGEFNPSVVETHMIHNVRNEYTNGMYVIDLMILEWSVGRTMSGYFGHAHGGFEE